MSEEENAKPEENLEEQAEAKSEEEQVASSEDSSNEENSSEEGAENSANTEAEANSEEAEAKDKEPETVLESYVKKEDPDEKQNLNLLIDTEMDVTVELGRSRIPLREMFNITRGSVIEVDRLANEPVDLLVNNKVIAKGEVVVVDDNIGFRIVETTGDLNLAVEMGLV